MIFLSSFFIETKDKFLKNILKGKIPLSDIIKQCIKPSVLIVKLEGSQKKYFEDLWLPVISLTIIEN